MGLSAGAQASMHGGWVCVSLVGGPDPLVVGIWATYSTCCSVRWERENPHRDGGGAQEIAGEGLAQSLSQDRPRQLHIADQAASLREAQEPGGGGGGCPLLQGPDRHGHMGTWRKQEGPHRALC